MPSGFLMKIGFRSGRSSVVSWNGRFPAHRFRVEILAEKGATLEAMHLKLASLPRRPDALIVYSGHNEFLARFSFANRVLYYDDDP